MTYRAHETCHPETAFKTFRHRVSRTTAVHCLRGQLFLALILAGAGPCLAAVQMQLRSNSGGVTISGASPSYSTNLGNVNGLGVGTPGVGVTVYTTGVSGGVLYTTPYDIYVAGVKDSVNWLEAYVSTNFSNPTILTLKSCPINTDCTSPANYSTFSTSAASPTIIIPSPGVLDKVTVTAAIGLFVADINGAGAFTGADAATITFKAYNTKDSTTDTVTLSVNVGNVQTAVRLNLATAAGGRTISPASDFSLNYGNVNGLGIGPGSGLTLVSASGGKLYTTPYLIKPEFSSFSSTTASVKTYVSLDFVHPSILELRDSSASDGPYSAISKSGGSPTILTNNAASKADITRYLGLFVSNANGASAFTGADSASLIFTLTVP